MMDRPFFSIIVVSYNAETEIEATIQSALSQDFSDFEIIVKDAVSKDGTLEKIPHDRRISVYSEKDAGIYDGMNQAIGYAKGKYLHFLNCGDAFADSKVLGDIRRHISDSKLEDAEAIVYGDYQRKDSIRIQPPKVTDFYLFRNPLNHQSMFFSSALIKKVGKYDASMLIFADYDLTLRSYFGGASFDHISRLICLYKGDGVSESPSNQKKKREEYISVVQRYYSPKQRLQYRLVMGLSMRRLRQFIGSDGSPQWLRKLYRAVVNKFNSGIR